MPDHVHLLIDCNGNDLSEIMRKVKLSFSKKYKFLKGIKSAQIWQRRFWDHIIRDQKDLDRHIDYIHFNPVKHGLSGNPFEWEYSTIQRYYQIGYYDENWEAKTDILDGDFGE
jgi:putative transposase